jgi:sn-glycerol 3-phosphate transport system substrate-binding protein
MSDNGLTSGCVDQGILAATFRSTQPCPPLEVLMNTHSRWLFRTAVTAFTVLCSSMTQAAPTKITFWHSMQGAEKTVNALTEAFNTSQDKYDVVARTTGTYTESFVKLSAVLRAKRAPCSPNGANDPTIYQVEMGAFARLADSGAIADLDSFEKTLSKEFISDFFGVIWNYGELNGKRYGLPWNASTPVLYYNATLFKARGLKPPTTWNEFIALNKTLTTRGTKGFIAIADSWQFEQMVLSRGGSLVAGDKPNLNSPEAIEALRVLQDLVKNNQAIPRSLTEGSTSIILDFVRTKAAMVIASIANWPDVLPYSVAFELGAAPLPRGSKTLVPFGGGQLTVLCGASKDEQAGALEFWRFLMRPENVVAWTKASYYVPVRRSALPLLKDWYAENPYRKVAFEQFDEAIARPKNPDFSLWEIDLREAMERVLKGGVDPKAALDEAQRKALSR